jgi:hypothetical protein
VAQRFDAISLLAFPNFVIIEKANLFEQTGIMVNERVDTSARRSILFRRHLRLALSSASKSMRCIGPILRPRNH